MRAREGWGKHYSLNYDPFTPQKIVRSKSFRIEPDTSRARSARRCGKTMGFHCGSPLFGGKKIFQLDSGALCLKMREPSLNETDAPPRRRSLTLATPQKSFRYDFGFARARFFPRKGKEKFFAGLCSDRAGGGASLRLCRLGIPPLHPPPAPSPP